MVAGETEYFSAILIKSGSECRGESGDAMFISTQDERDREDTVNIAREGNVLVDPRGEYACKTMPLALQYSLSSGSGL